MIRPIFTLSILAFAFYILLPASGSVFGLNAGPASAATDLMQCMESCIRHEGGNSATNKETCKSRCANVPMSAPGRGGPPDCMARYKDCRGACAKNKSCRKACKKRLMSCK